MTVTGAAVTEGSAVTVRNKIQGDFRFDGVRTIDDIDEMLEAWHSRNGGPAWNGDGSPDAVIELLGDFNNDGQTSTRSTSATSPTA
ncbi:MAG: hypothetical protein HC927_08270 [Deltaproteobacteria bacterium]|nr:hypothetical protein [Deltaproteobacteria bacterium]